MAGSRGTRSLVVLLVIAGLVRGAGAASELAATGTVDAIRRFIEQQHAHFVGDPARGGLGLSSVVSSAQGGTGSSTGTKPLAVDDLDGDGRDDVLTASYVNPDGCSIPLVVPGCWANSSNTLALRNGATGEPIWETAAPLGVLYGLITDLTGDGLPDSVSVTLEYGGISTPVSAYITVLTTVQARSGTTGAILWHTRFDTTVQVVGGVLRFADALDTIEAVGDAGGSAAPDLLITLLDWTTDGLSGVNVERVEGTVYSGPDGTPLGTVDAEALEICPLQSQCVGEEAGAGGSAYVLAAGDVGGDDRADLFVMETATSRTLRAVSADGSVAYWQYSIPVRARPLAVELTGDQRRDVLFTALPPSSRWPFMHEAVLAVDGTTGNELWATPERNAIEAQIVGDLDGDGGTDILHEKLPGPTGGVLEVTSGATGETVRAIQVPSSFLPGPGGLVHVSAADDLDGDGNIDVLLHDFRSSESGRQTASIAVDLSDGSTIWRSPIRSGDEGFLFVVATDVDGDGSRDVAAPVLAGLSIRLELFSGADLTPLGSPVVPIESDTTLVNIFGGGDVNGDGTGEVVLWTFEPESRTQVVNASTVLWRER